MSTRIVDAVTLDIRGSGTVVPQSIDNQFMPAKVFREVQKRRFTLAQLLEGGLSQRTGRDAAARFFAVHKTEYLRSLLYSRRVVVNRAAFWAS